MNNRKYKKRMKQSQSPNKPYVCEVVDLPKGYEDKYPFKEGDHVLMLGEIEYMPGHVAVVTRDGLVRWGYHVEYFRKLTREEA
jgi:hypothetical protein